MKIEKKLKYQDKLRKKCTLNSKEKLQLVNSHSFMHVTFNRFRNDSPKKY